MSQVRISIFLSILVTSLLLTCCQEESDPIVLTTISIKEPVKVNYIKGEVLDLSGLVVTFVMNNGEVEDIPFSAFASKGITCTPANGSVIESEMTSVVISHAATGKEVIHPIVVNKVTDISVVAPPTKVNYLLNETLDLTGVIVKLTMENAETREVHFHDFANWGITTMPINGALITDASINVVVTYTPNDKSTNQPITVRTVTDISVKMAPSQLVYYPGDVLELSGLVIKLSLDNGDSRDVPFEEFDDLAIITTPVNGTVLTMDSTSITIRHSHTGKTTNQIISFFNLTDIENNVYPLIKIGNQIWMQENLKTTTYQNGDAIGTTVPATMDIKSETAPQYQWAYDGDESNVPLYGRLYTQFVAVDNRNVCPVGWRVPTENDFWELLLYLINNGYNFDNSTSGNKIGKALAATTHWQSTTYIEGVPGNNPEANNRSGFTGLASGIRVNFADVFLHSGTTTFWWSTNQDIALRIQSFQQVADIVSIGDKNTGAPIRCLKN